MSRIPAVQLPPELANVLLPPGAYSSRAINALNLKQEVEHALEDEISHEVLEKMFLLVIEKVATSSKLYAGLLKKLWEARSELFIGMEEKLEIEEELRMKTIESVRSQQKEAKKLHDSVESLWDFLNQVKRQTEMRESEVENILEKITEGTLNINTRVIHLESDCQMIINKSTGVRQMIQENLREQNEVLLSTKNLYTRSAVIRHRNDEIRINGLESENRHLQELLAQRHLKDVFKSSAFSSVKRKNMSEKGVMYPEPVDEATLPTNGKGKGSSLRLLTLRNP